MEYGYLLYISLCIVMRKKRSLILLGVYNICVWLFSDCVTGRDEWFPEYQTCIWIPTKVYPYEEAKRLCESAGKVMLGTNNFSQVLDLMDLLNTSKFKENLHVQCTF